MTTQRQRDARARNEARQNPALPSEGRASAVEGHTRTWLVKQLPTSQPSVVWIKRPMPDGEWPPNRRQPRDDSFSWWVRSHCGHDGGARQWAFYAEADADQYQQIFRADPCHYTRCADRIMIENDPKRSW